MPDNFIISVWPCSCFRLFFSTFSWRCSLVATSCSFCSFSFDPPGHPGGLSANSAVFPAHLFRPSAYGRCTIPVVIPFACIPFDIPFSVPDAFRFYNIYFFCRISFLCKKQSSKVEPDAAWILILASHSLRCFPAEVGSCLFRISLLVWLFLFPHGK